ncbi:hypothetical protein SCHPADRAFT_945461 [Schizopora paradoxa]|uniref:BTB domain-containing protein n=1 Tax=Schizopora paradoxa TaxID=27342 RepID=A0A0H2R775_9AGAM|nr:hypothetical protein SCHPADRAFT_945461 [Schizopora paradoxa]
MPPKRPRTTESSPSTDGKRQKVTSLAPQPHEKLWFSDGTIVLATDVHLYRVHKGMLAKHSTVLNDMFEMPTGDANTERWEDVPIVKMVGDKDEEISILLEALYDRHFHDTVRGLKLSKLSSLLSVSAKYDFLEIRADVVSYLESMFPTKFEDLEEAKKSYRPHLVKDICELVAVALRCDALLILPFLYYLLSRAPFYQAIKYLYALPQDRFTIFLLGRDWLREVSHDFIKVSLQSNRTGEQDAKICRYPECLEKIRARLPKDPNVIVFDFPDRRLMQGLEMYGGVCKNCEQDYIQTLKKAKEDAWKNLPVKFLNMTWEELRRT